MPEEVAMSASPTGEQRVDPLEMAPHYYGGQAVIEGVMMRGADTWAVAIRRPDDSIWVETHPVTDLPRRRPWITKPLVRGVFALGDSLSIGMKALNIAAREAFDEDGESTGAGAVKGAGNPRMSRPDGPSQSAAVDGGDDSGNLIMGASMVLALVLFVGLFIFLPSAGVKVIDRFLLGSALGDGAGFHLVESVVRIAIFLGYLGSISLIADIRRVFQYHGAEHATITAWEHGEELDPSVIIGHSTLHVRCGTNFLIMVMLLALVVYTAAGVLVPAPEGGFMVGVAYQVALRVVLLPVVAGLAYEGLRLGAGHSDNLVVRGMMKPGLWLQMITTKPPTADQVEVAIRAFEAVVPAEHLVGRVITTLPSRLVGPDSASPLPGDDAGVTA